MALLPYINDQNELTDGSYFHFLPFCKQQCLGEKCQTHYKRMRGSDAGSYRCPYGLSSYIYASPAGKIIFSGLRIKGVYDKKKARITEAKEYIYNPVIEESACASIAKETAISLFEKQELEGKLEAIRDLLHETRSLNGQIKNTIDLLWETNADESYIDHDAMVETLKNAHVSSFMISNRFAYFDSILNPTLSMGSAYSAVVFKKFDKMRKLLRGYQRKNVWISLDSPTQSNYRYKIYPTFETLLFIVLENAIKYSPNNKSVDVIFAERDHLLEVTIKLIGPYCDENEILHLCDKGFRGENARMAQSTGQGFGLNFAQKICLAHNIKVTFDSVYLNKDHGVKYGTFSVHLHFDNSLENSN